jgi:hypothetical protein
VDVRDDGGDRPSLAAGRLSAPGSRIEMLEDDLIHPLVDRVTLHEHLAKIDAIVSV